MILQRLMGGQRRVLHAFLKNATDSKAEKMKLAAREERVKTMILQRLMGGQRRVLHAFLKNATDCKAERAARKSRQEQERIRLAAREEKIKSLILQRLMSGKRHVFYAFFKHASDERAERVEEAARLEKERMELAVREDKIKSMILQRLMSGKRHVLYAFLKNATDCIAGRAALAVREERVKTMILQRLMSGKRQVFYVFHKNAVAAKVVQMELEARNARVKEMILQRLMSGKRRVLHAFLKYATGCKLLRIKIASEREQRAAEMAKLAARNQAVKAMILQRLMSVKRQVFYVFHKNAVEAKVVKIELAARDAKVKAMILRRLMSGKRCSFQILRRHAELAKESKKLYQQRLSECLRFISSRQILLKRHVLQKWNRFTATRIRTNEARERSHAAAMRKFQQILASTKQHSFTKWSRHTRKVRSSYAIAMTKFKDALQYTKRMLFSRWVRYAHDVRLRKVVENSQMRAVLEMVKQQDSGRLRRAMATWHRLVLANKLEQKRVSHREARMLDMMSHLVAKGIRRILHRWHSTAVLARAERGEGATKQARIQHAVDKATKLLSSHKLRALAKSVKKWWHFALHDRSVRDSRHMACRRVVSLMCSWERRLKAHALMRLKANLMLALSLENEGGRLCNAKGMIMRGIVQRLLRAQLWRGLNQWRLFAEIQRHRLWQHNTQAQQKERAAAALRRIVLGWSKKRLRTGWRSWQTWNVAFAADAVRQANDAACQDRATKTLRAVIGRVTNRIAARAWRQWGLVTTQQRQKEAADRTTADIGAKQLERTMSRVLATFRLRSLSMAMRTWTYLLNKHRATQCLQRIIGRLLNAKLWRAFRKLSVEAEQHRLLNAKKGILMRSIVQRLLRQKMSRGFNKWVLSAEMKRHLLWRQDSDEKQKERAAAALRRIVLRWSKKEIHQALRQWCRVCRCSARLEQDGMRTDLAKGQDAVARLLSQAEAADRARQSRDATVRAEYEAQLEALRRDMRQIEETSTSDVARKQLELTRLEEECTKVYETQQARDAATHAAYEGQLEELRRKMDMIEERARADVAKKQLEVAHLASKCAAVDRSQQSRDAAYETQLAEARDKMRAIEEKARAAETATGGGGGSGAGAGPTACEEDSWALLAEAHPR